MIRGIVERLDAKSVACDEQELLAFVPDGERKHAVDLFEETLSSLEVEMQQNFGVGGRAKAMTTLRQPLGEAGVIVALAIVGDPHRPVLAAHRLMAGGRQVDDRQSAMAKSDIAAQHMAAVIRPSMRDQLRHPFEEARIRARPRIELEDSGDAAHQQVSMRSDWLVRSLASTFARGFRARASTPFPP